MTSEEYATKEKEEFDNANIPQEFRSAISYHAYEQGHAYGYNEIFSHLSDLIEAFKDPIKAFEKRIRDNVKNYLTVPPWKQR